MPVFPAFTPYGAMVAPKHLPLDSLVSTDRQFIFWSAIFATSLALWYLKASKKGSKSQKSDPTDFHSFLKAVPKEDPRQPTSFDSFLKGGVEETQAVRDEDLEDQGPPHGNFVKVPVVFGTEYGLSKEVAEKLCKELKESGKYWPILMDMANYGEGFDLASEQVALFVCSTQGDGVPPPEARDFCEWLFDQGAGDLSGVIFSVCALGDRAYPHFCQCGKRIHESLIDAGGRNFVDCKEVDRENWKSLDKWIHDVIEGLSPLELCTAEELGVDLSAPALEKRPAKWCKSIPYSAKICKIEGLCNVTDKQDKNTVLVEFDLGDSGIEFVPGDALGIYPQNCPEAVDELLSTLHASGKELIKTPSWYVHSDLERLEDAERLEKPSQINLLQALTDLYDIKTPKSSLYAMLWKSVTADLLKQVEIVIGKNGQAESSNSRTSPGGKDDQKVDPHIKQVLILKELMEDSKKMEEYQEQCHLIDFLTDFNFVSLSVQQVVACLRPLQPRLYSISSSPLEDPRKVGITVAEVVYSSRSRLRKGVASTYLSQRSKTGLRLPVYVSKNPDFRLPDLSTPIIMVGPGTGLAPFRAFIWERLLTQSQIGGTAGKQVLYFGCRSRHQDYLYGDLLEAWSREGVIQLITAFSREQEKKIYVQHRLQETQNLVWELLEQGAHFYVCGDAAAMAGDVEKVLVDIISTHKECSILEAQDYLDHLGETGRYQRDVWF